MGPRPTKQFPIDAVFDQLQHRCRTIDNLDWLPHHRFGPTFGLNRGGKGNLIAGQFMDNGDQFDYFATVIIAAFTNLSHLHQGL